MRRRWPVHHAARAFRRKFNLKTKLLNSYLLWRNNNNNSEVFFNVSAKAFSTTSEECWRGLPPLCRYFQFALFHIWFRLSIVRLDARSRKINKICTVKKHGARVHVFAVDVKRLFRSFILSPTDCPIHIANRLSHSHRRQHRSIRTYHLENLLKMVELNMKNLQRCASAEELQ
jgi:hypothetical protein